MKLKLITLAVVLCLGSFCASGARAQTIFWTGAGADDFFHNPANWSTSEVPTPSDDVIFNLPSSSSVSFSSGAVSKSLSVLNGDVTFDLQGNSYTVNDNVDIISALTGNGLINAGSLLIGSAGVLALAIEDSNSFGRFVVEGLATRGGTLIIDATNYTAPIGTEFSIITTDLGGGILGNFAKVETVGSSTIFFADPDSAPSSGPISGEAHAGAHYNSQSYSIGDMNLDNYVDSDDAPDFALGLLDPLQYSDTHGYMFPVQAGDFYTDGSFDFDDIEGFTTAVGGALAAADIVALFNQMSVPEPTTGGLLLFACGMLSATRLQRHACSVGQSG